MARILVPIDGSEAAWTALDHSLRVFEGADLEVIHVVDPMETHYGTDGQLIHTQEEYDRIRERADRLCATAERRAAEFDAAEQVHTHVEVDRNPARAIVEFAGEHEVDQIVLGSHGKSRFQRVLLGSVAETVARRSPVPVTIVR